MKHATTYITLIPHETLGADDALSFREFLIESAWHYGLTEVCIGHPTSLLIKLEKVKKMQPSKSPFLLYSESKLKSPQIMLMDSETNETILFNEIAIGADRTLSEDMTIRAKERVFLGSALFPWHNIAVWTYGD